MVLPSRRALLVLILVAGALLAGSGVFSLGPAHEPAAVRGVLDLTAWDPTTEPVALDGQWAFYWGQLIGTDGFAGAAAAPAPTGFLQLPGTWRRFRSGAGGLPAGGYGTLHLRVEMPETSALMAVRIPVVFSAYRLWANGEQIAAAGTVGTAAAASQPQYRPQMAVFEPHGTTVDLVLQISNYHEAWSGLARSIQFGTFEQVIAAKGRELRLWASALAALALLGLQNLFLYARRRRELDLIVGCFLLAGALTAANDNELLFINLKPGVGWELHWKLEYLAGFLLIMLATRIVRVLFPWEAPAAVSRAGLLIGGAGLAVVLLTPARIYTSLQPVFHLLALLTIIHCLSVALRAVERGRPNGWVILVSGVAVTIWLEREWPRYYGLLSHGISIGWVAAFAAAFGMAFIHLFDHRELANTATTLVIANSELTDRLREQVAELQSARQLLSAQEEEMHRKTAEALHSRVQSKLLVAGYHLGQAEQWLGTDPEQGRRELEIAQSQIEAVREKDIRQVSHLLHPAVISVGLGPAVQSLVSEHSGSMRIAVQMSPEVAALDDVTENRIPERVRLAAYRVLAEALGNVQAHAGATAARVDLGLTPAGELLLAVADNGRGFDPNAVTPGLGLRTMAARLAECDGSLEWERRPEGGGACLRVRIPLRAPGTAAS